MKSILCIILYFSIPSINALLDTANCVRLQSCIRSKANCQDSGSCHFLIMYQFDNSAGTVKVDFSVQGSNLKWISLGLNPTNQTMKGTSAVVCVRKDASTSFYRVITAPDHTSPNWNQFTTNNVTQTTIKYDKGALECSFTRPISQAISIVPWKAKQYLMLAYGDTLASNDLPRKHSATIISKDKVDLAADKKESVFVASTGTSLKAIVILVSFLATLASIFMQ